MIELPVASFLGSIVVLELPAADFDCTPDVTVSIVSASAGQRKLIVPQNRRREAHVLFTRYGKVHSVSVCRSREQRHISCHVWQQTTCQPLRNIHGSCPAIRVVRHRCQRWQFTCNGHQFGCHPWHTSKPNLRHRHIYGTLVFVMLTMAM